MDPVVDLTLRTALALLFFVAAGHKLRDPGRFRATVAEYRLVPDRFAPPAAALLVAVEAAAAGALLVPGVRAAGLLAAAALLVVYGAAIAINLARGRWDIDCGCAGPAVRRPIGGWLVARNAVLAAAALAGLARQIGVLHERVAPAGALMVGKGPAVGEPAPVVSAPDLAGTVRDVGGPSAEGRSTLLFFLSPTCPVCKALLPMLRSIARRERDWLGIVLASDGPRDEHEAFVRAERLEAFPYLLSPALGITYRVGKLPYAVPLDAAG